MAYETNPKSAEIKLPNGETMLVESFTIAEMTNKAVALDALVLDALQDGMPIIKVSRASLMKGEMPTVEATSYDAWKAAMKKTNERDSYHIEFNLCSVCEKETDVLVIVWWDNGPQQANNICLSCIQDIFRKEAEARQWRLDRIKAAQP